MAVNRQEAIDMLGAAQDPLGRIRSGTAPTSLDGRPFAALLRAVSSGSRIQDGMLALLAVVVICLMVLPLPTALLDMLIAVNIGLSVLLLMLSMYVPTPLGLSTFPTLLLFTTLLRLSLSIASARLILLNADAGRIIETFGNLVVGGNVVVGIVVFLIIAVVQFIVVAKGAERVAEVGARFTLDALPGKQMSIDAELRAGILNKDEARSKRHQLQRESQLFGAMDGAMKFVKGDAIAGLLIALVNLIAGMAIGVGMLGLPFGSAASTYSILSVGDGLISQIPSLFVSLAAGILITRVSSDEQAGARGLGQEIGHQISLQPKALLVTAAVMLMFMLVPGFPKLQFLAWGLLFAGAGLLLRLLSRRREPLEPMKAEALHRDGIARPRSAGELDAELVTTYPVALRLSRSLTYMLEDDTVQAVVRQAREQVTRRLGVPFPGIGVQIDDSLDDGAFAVLVNEIPAANGQTSDDLGQALATVLARNAGEFIGLQEVKFLLAESELAFPDLVAEASRVVPIQRMTEVLRRLVAEGVAVRNMRDILQSLLDWAPREKDIVMLTEHVRNALARQITYQAGGGDTIHVLTFDSGLEELIRSAIRTSPAGGFLALDADRCETIKQRVMDKARIFEHEHGGNLVVLVSMDIRRYVAHLLGADPSALRVLAYQNLVPGAPVLGFTTLGA